MSIFHKLPPKSSPIREFFDEGHLMAIAYNEADPVWGLAEAKRMARETFEANPAARRLYYIVMEDDGYLSLFRINPLGGETRLWTFGMGRRGMLSWD
jgi:hypothetical protein